MTEARFISVGFSTEQEHDYKNGRDDASVEKISV